MTDSQYQTLQKFFCYELPRIPGPIDRDDLEMQPISLRAPRTVQSRGHEEAQSNFVSDNLDGTLQLYRINS
jgi:hypothetical protein